MTRATRPCAAFLVALTIMGATLPVASHADAFCDSLHDLVDQARDNFAQFAPDQTLPDALACGVSLTLTGARQVQCHWGFDYRDAAAEQTFLDYDDRLRSCLGISAPAQPDAGVNHPDTYVLHQYRAGPIALTLSLKDKAALGRSFVFLGVQGRLAG